MPATGADVLVSALESLGVEAVFGLPGVHNLAAWEALRESPIRLIGVRHEQAAVYAADGFARATGRLGVALVTTGPGAANTLAAVGEAWASHSPVLVIATDIPTTIRQAGVHRGALHECADQPAMFAPVTKERHRADPSSIRSLTRDAAAGALAAPTRPVYLEVPTDVLSAPAGDEETAVAERPPSSSEATELRDRVAESERPLLWVGSGARDAAAEVARVADLL